jgi:hypothetical protein
MLVGCFSGIDYPVDNSSLDFSISRVCFWRPIYNISSVSGFETLLDCISNII